MARHALILAGGAGVRLWPLSRAARPKQLLPLVDGASLLHLAVRRCAALFAPENTWVVTLAAHAAAAAQELAELPAGNIIAEPLGRDTANAIGLACAIIANRDPDATIGVFSADHHIEPIHAFQTAVRDALSAAEAHPTALVALGVPPTAASTAYGYIHVGAAAAELGAARCVRGFREKPDSATAQRFFESGEYWWNCGIFAWRADALRANLQRHLPENDAKLRAIVEKLGPGRGPATPQFEDYAALPRISIDHGVLERCEEVLVVPLACRWIDLGTWEALAAIAPQDDAGNAQLAAKVIAMDSRRNLLVSESDHLIVALGVEDLVIVHAADATLVCRRGDVDRLKALQAERQRRFGEQYE